MRDDDGDQALRAYRTVLAALRDPGAGEGPALAALALIGGLRRHLDQAERELIDLARGRGAAWTRIAGALGLASRQAAEQRWLRLAGGTARDVARARADRARQRNDDMLAGAGLSALRTSVRSVYRDLSADPAWSTRHQRAGLARETLAVAVDAAPGALFDLAGLALADLDAIPAARLDGLARTAVRRLRKALAAASPTRK